MFSLQVVPLSFICWFMKNGKPVAACYTRSMQQLSVMQSWYFIYAWKITKKKIRDVLTLDSVAEHSRPLNTFSANFQELLFEYVCNALDFCSSLKSFFFTMFLKLIFQIMFDNTQLPCIYSAKNFFFLKFFSPKFFKIIQRGFPCLVNTYS